MRFSTVKTLTYELHIKCNNSKNDHEKKDSALKLQKFQKVAAASTSQLILHQYYSPSFLLAEELCSTSHYSPSFLLAEELCPTSHFQLAHAAPVLLFE